MDKYIITNNTVKVFDHILYRIQAVSDFSDVRAGDFGGYIEKESNLSQDGDCWIYDNAKVFDNGCVCDNAKIRDYVKVYQNAKVCDNAEAVQFVNVCDNAIVGGNALICGNTFVGNDDKIGISDKE